MSQTNTTTRFGVSCSRQYLQRCGEQRAGRRTAEHAFLGQQFARGQEALLVADRVGLLHARKIADRRQEILADALDHPACGFGRKGTFVDVLREDRSDRIGEDEFSGRRNACEVVREAGHGAGRTAAEHDRIDPAVKLLEDLRTGGLLVRERIVGVAELVDEVRARCFARNALGEVLVVLRMALGDIGASQYDLGPHRLEVEDLLAAHLVRHDQDQPVTLRLARPGRVRVRCCPRCLRPGSRRV